MRRTIWNTLLKKVSIAGWIRLFSVVWLLFPGFALAAGSTASAQMQTFTSAEQAFGVIAEAYRNNDEKLLIELFGEEFKGFVEAEDKTAAREDRLKFTELYDEYSGVVYDNEKRAILLIGRLAWPFPIPVIREDGRWYFDAAQGYEEILDRRVGRNELAVIDICKAYVKAQWLYASEDRDGDEVAEFAQKLISTPGTQNGLYWQSDERGELSPLGPLFSKQADYFAGKKLSEPVWGYYYRILTSQGDKVPGGRYNYVINDNKIAGFALLAYPANYTISGIMTFVINHRGLIYQKDLGEDTIKFTAELMEYNPDETWNQVAEE